jgi:hypothetical protein
MTTRYRVSLQWNESPVVWVQALAEECTVSITRIVDDPLQRRRKLVIDEVPLAQVDDYVAQCEMSSAVVTLRGIRHYDERFRPFIEGLWRVPDPTVTMVVAQFDGVTVDALPQWQEWAKHDSAVESACAVLQNVAWSHSIEENRDSAEVALMMLEVVRSTTPSPLVLPPGLLPGTIFYPYCPMIISSAWPTTEEK